MPRIIYDIEEEWSVAVGGSLYAAEVGKPASEWKVTVEAWPTRHDDQARMAELNMLTLSGPSRHMLAMLKDIVSQLECMELEYVDQGLVVRKEKDGA